LQALDYSLAEFGGRLLVRIGDPAKVVPETVAKLGVETVFWNADVTPYSVARDRQVTGALSTPVETYWGSLVHEPGSVLTAKGTLFKQDFNGSTRRGGAPVGSVARARRAPAVRRPGEPDADPRRPTTVFQAESEAKMRLEQFLERVDQYDVDRDRRVDGTSMLSADLRFGTCHPAVADAVGEETQTGPCSCASSPGATGTHTSWPSCRAFRAVRCGSASTEIEWRNDPRRGSGLEGRLHRLPDRRRRHAAATETGLDAQPRPDDRRVVPGEGPARRLAAGRTPLPLPARRRRRAAERGQLAVGAGTGPDALPYHRIFNPVTQSRKFDPTGVHPTLGARSPRSTTRRSMPGGRCRRSTARSRASRSATTTRTARRRAEAPAGAGGLRRGRRRQVVRLAARRNSITGGRSREGCQPSADGRGTAEPPTSDRGARSQARRPARRRPAAPTGD
jgi:deoxyribodipyrimidine photo-lyase